MSLENYPALCTLMSVLPPDALRDGDRVRVGVQNGKVFPQRGTEVVGISADVMARPLAHGGCGVWLTYESSNHGDVDRQTTRRIAAAAAQKFHGSVRADTSEVIGLTDENAVLCFWHMVDLMLVAFPESPKETVR